MPKIENNQPVNKQAEKNAKQFYSDSITNIIHKGTFLETDNVFADYEKKMATKPANVYVVDIFASKSVDIDGDKIPDIAHGEVTEAIIKSQTPNIKTTRMDCSDTEDAHCYNSQALLSNLKELNTKIKNGEKIDGINISLSLNMDYKKINSMKNTHFNLKSKNPEFLTTLNAIKTIEKITSNNVPVFVAAGNYDDSFNALGLADKTTVVGGTYRNTKVSMFSQNSTVNAWDESIWPVNPIISDDKKVVGYDVTNDGILDIPASATSSNGKCEKKDITIGGTSIAAPNHFRKYLEQR